MLEKYLKNILKTFNSGDATEESYYPMLNDLFQNFFDSENIGNGTITSLPKKKEGNKPDFVIRKGKELVGYIEAKDFSKVDNLEKIDDSEQIERYKNDFDNFILTNFVDFWLWRKSESKWVKKVRICQSRLITHLKTLIAAENPEQCRNLFEEFINFSIPETKTAKQLAIELALRAKRMREPLYEELTNEIESDVDKIYRAFKKYLMPDLSEDNFVDIYAQTITYGLFIARLQFQGEGKDFNRMVARDLIPKNLKILRDTFSFVSRRDLTQNIDYIIDDIATVLAYCNVEKIKKDLHEEKGKDPIVHFYETFLIEYDPEKRKKMGEYYTPLPVVSYIVRSLNILLKEKFGKKVGFASSGVTLLDFSAGTCTFPAKAITQTKEEIDASNAPGSWSSVAKDHILENFYAFEISMASWIIGHLKIALLLESLGYKMTNGDRFKLYLTNALDFTQIQGQDEILISDLSEEAKMAGEVKKEKSILVIMGNPPYSVSSSNVIKSGSDFHQFYESYKETVRKEEKNIQPLSDDYIKFIAFAHWKIKQLGKGLIGIITNNSYLDGLIHRDLRRKILEDFNEIYILNLNGSARRQANSAKKKKDENVFNIQQGVSIILLSKNGTERNIKYADLFGSRGEKFGFLDSHTFENTKWQKLEPKAPNYFFVPKDDRGEETYQQFVSIKDIFEKYNAGIATGKDAVLVDFSKNELARKMSIADKNVFNIFMQSHKVSDGLIEKWYQEIKQKEIDSQIKIYNYRPFDCRFTIYNGKILQRARKDITDNFLIENIGLCTIKQFKLSEKKQFGFALITEDLTCRDLITNHTYVFPIWIYNKESSLIFEENHPAQKDLFNGGDCFDSKARKSNIKIEIIDKLSKVYKSKTNPEDIFYYIYGILYSNKYRQKYNEFLKTDFPKIPFAKEFKVFEKVSKLGKELAELHLLKSVDLKKTDAKFPKDGDRKVKKRQYKDGKIYINDEQYFGETSPEVWNYFIGGYQVLDKWLKDRIDRTLSAEDVNHYLKIITALQNTIKLQKEIDEIYPEVEKKIINNLLENFES